MQTISLYSGAGNRFVVLDRPDKISEEQLGALSKTLCGKAQGFGVDGALYLVRQQSIWRMLYFNKDGSRAAFCGNGLRCFASHLYRTGRVHTKTFLVQTDCGVRRAVILHHDLVQVEMGNARFCPCPKLTLPDFVQKAVLVEMNVPHLVLFTKKQPADLVERWGPVFEKNPAFLHRVNVNFVQKNGAKLKASRSGFTTSWICWPWLICCSSWAGVPCATTRPWWMMRMVSHTACTSDRMWEERMMVCSLAKL